MTISLDPRYYKGKRFVIQTSGNSAAAPFVQQFRLNGRVLHEPRLRFADFAQGGLLEMEMGGAPKDAY